MSTSTYAAWVSWLEAFRRGEDPPTDHLGAVGPGMGSYVEARLVDRIAVVLAARVRAWQTALGERIVARPPSGAADAEDLLREAWSRLEPLVALAGSPLLPAPLRSSLGAALVDVREGARTAVDEAWRRRLEDRVLPIGTAARPVLPGARVPAPRRPGPTRPAPAARPRLPVTG